jgi:group I intron endonuclease
MESGIYAIMNKANGKFYIGSAQDFNDRWKQHTNDLAKGKHHSIHLQRAWDYYGEDYFEIIILEEVAKEDLEKEEQYYLDSFHPWDKEIGYNTAVDSHAPPTRETS